VGALALAVVALALPSSAQEGVGRAAIERGPIVSFDEKGATTVDVVVNVAAAADGLKLSAWLDGDAKRTFPFTVVDGRRFRATLDGIAPATTVSYSIGELATVFHLLTPPAPKARRWTFCAYGDSGWPRRGAMTASEEQLAVAKVLEAQSPDLVLNTGDVIYFAGQESGFDPLFFKPYAGTLSRVPLFSCLGNHDVVTKDGAPELAAFPFPRNAPGSHFYSFDFANAHFVVLDTNEIIEHESADAFLATEQGKFLRADLAASQAEWKIAMFHHPIYACPSHKGRMAETEHARLLLEKTLLEGGVELVLSGHHHYYYRAHRARDGKRDESGLVQVVTGGGGAMLNDGAEPNELTAASAKRFHLVRFDVDGLTLSLEALAPTTGGKLERFDAVKIASRRVR
jgi:hypothetical protein